MAKTDKVSSQPLVTELNVSANIMAIEPGLYCIFHVDNAAIDPATGLPGVRITPPPGAVDPDLEIRTFGEGGWVGGAAAMVQTPHQASVLVTVYRDAAAATQGPQLQVVRLGDAPKPLAAGTARTSAPARPASPLPAPQPEAPPPPAPPSAPESAVSREEAEVAAHIQRRGDVLSRIGEWMGTPGSQQWIEGFALAPRGEIGIKDIEYQAVLGRGWLSPWSEGGQFCGSRGMALPILGLRVRLKGAFASTHSVQVEASFTDGTHIGPVEEDIPVEAPSLAPLEAFRLRLTPLAVLAAPGDAPIGDDTSPDLAAELLQASPPRARPGRRPSAPPVRAAAKASAAAPSVTSRGKPSKGKASKPAPTPVRSVTKTKPVAAAAKALTPKGAKRGRPPKAASAPGPAASRLAALKRSRKAGRGGRS